MERGLETHETIRFRSRLGSDYVIYRYVDGVGFRPTLAFQSAVDDKDMRITHLYRGVDLQSSQPRLRQIYEGLPGGRPFPQCIYWGRIRLYSSLTKEVFELSKSARKDPWIVPGLMGLTKTYGSKAVARFLESYGGTKNNIGMDIQRLRVYHKKLRGGRRS